MLLLCFLLPFCFVGVLGKPIFVLFLLLLFQKLQSNFLVDAPVIGDHFQSLTCLSRKRLKIVHIVHPRHLSWELNWLVSQNRLERSFHHGFGPWDRFLSQIKIRFLIRFWEIQLLSWDRPPSFKLIDWNERMSKSRIGLCSGIKLLTFLVVASHCSRSEIACFKWWRLSYLFAFE